ncbi:MAG TPA: prolyl-tRNA synthetase associated domain-containing protein [Oligoflexia bacterium]|nr:prolyl-tRNA synthetase associated domain-containing protein [Oligoflexia bacterium]HMP27088.1 prolyl-tRNA synthetase associated domain-containing protein [Oligoflexia bacterium]
MNCPELLLLLKRLEIDFEYIEHPKVRTVSEAKKILSSLQAVGSKNLFLQSERERNFYLLAAHEDKRIDLKALALELGSSSFSFGKADDLKALLGVEPGAVSILGLIFDTQKKVRLLIDRDLYGQPKIQCHPLVNTASLIVNPLDLQRFFDFTGHIVEVINVPSLTSKLS